MILLDALGTLVALEPPAPRLRAELAERFGLDVSEAQAGAAFAAEIAYYRAHLDEGRDASGLRELRRRCAEALRAALPAGAASLELDRVAEALLASLRFTAFADVGPALMAARTRGQRLVVVSNWDVSLHDVLRALGLEPLLDAIITSAEAGVRKPGAAIFEQALALAGGGAASAIDPASAIHVGDSLEEDVVGARAAGIEPVLVRREHRDTDFGAPVDHTSTQSPKFDHRREPVPGVRTISSLAELAGLVVPGPA